MLTGAGVRVHRNNDRLSLAPLTDAAVKDMSAGEILEPKLIRAKDLKPERGGLFDPAVTGGLSGTKWGHINLAEPIVSPTFQEPVRRLLGMTTPELNKTLADKGGKFIRSELAKIDLKKRKADLRRSMKKKSANNLDNEVKQLKYIKSLEAQGLTPDKAYIISKVPVVPPVVRPVLPGRNSQDIIYGDINPLYRDLIYTNNQFKDVKKAAILPSEEKRLRPVLQEAVGAVYGVNDPITAKSKARNHKGFLTYISGTNAPKHGYFHSKLMYRAQDVAGRGTIVPDVTLGMDEVGLPEDMIWSMYDKFLIKGLIQRGYSATQAASMVKERHPAAKAVMQSEIQTRPVMLNRAPTLHRVGLVGAFPKPVPGKTIRVSPFVEEGMNADYDGDTMMVHVPVGAKAVEEAKQMTLSNVLYGDKSRKDLLVFPQHEAIMGIAHAAEQDKRNTPVKFKTKGEARKAYLAGNIGLGTRVEIGK